jgi:hypothetical protein
MTLDPDDMPGGWADSIARRDAEADTLCATCGHWYATDGGLCGLCREDAMRAASSTAGVRS